MAGVLGLFLYELIKTSETVARIFGKAGRAVYDRVNAPRRTLRRVEHIEELLSQTSDKLECATTYLVIDADYHHQEDIILAENCPGVFRLLPKRIPFTEFSRKWQEGWRP
ncbi:hypothetical protein DQP57_00445 [Mycobacterium colombiense]|uniref:Uncharacterized protein n=1 Tax=Mycobacterium colombiense TaxID=339268 RepID=A0A329MCU8_9MYCO|nr:hypothetical protein [Mycobacterium colombiense]RAV17528.1 hypothetical protein DQP57_00445 [Mycobacterium colombiense]